MAIIRPTFNPYIQILWNGEEASIPCLFLFTDLKRYVFNCSEGTQRLFTQRRVKLGKLDTFFMTRYQWSHMGGLPGFGMTLRDMKSDGMIKARMDEVKKNSNVKSKEIEKLHNIKIYAPPGMDDVIKATKHFLKFDQSDVNFVVTHEQTYKDEEITVQSIPLYSNKIGSTSKTWNFEGKYTQNIDFPNPFPPSVCYACQLCPLPGRFDVKTAIKLGVPKGPMFGLLQKGETVELVNGKKVAPEEVIGPETPGPTFLLIDCPDLSYIENLTKNDQFDKYFLEKGGTSLVIHLSPRDVCMNAVYSEWTKKFSSSTKHIFINDLKNDNAVYNSQHNLQIMLNRISSKCFPLFAEPMETKQSDVLRNFMKIYPRELLKNPKKVFDYKDISSKTSHSELIKRVEKVLKKVGRDDLLWRGDVIAGKRPYSGDKTPIPNKKVNLGDNSGSKPTYESDKTQLYPKIVCLGTGASLPSKFRNVSATLIINDEDNAVLFDCGEGTYGQLQRHYGNKLNEILLKIKFIFISHMHADHHLGLIMLITELKRLKTETKESVIVMGPYLLLQWMTGYALASQAIKLSFISCEDALQGISVRENLYVHAVKVDHPGSAHGVVINYKGIKTTYSGDTMPCRALIDTGYNTKFLIHEATLEDDMIEDAKDRKHSTTNQALTVAQQMNAEFVVLTHFSQRYPKLQAIKDDTLSSKVVYAFDHMEVTPNEIQHFCKIVPILNALFDEEGDI